ncbi:hypothetical protein D3C72_1998940 [compost metagenome]
MRQAMTQFNVAVAQDGHLTLDQRHGIAAPMGDTQGREQFFVLDEEVRMSLQVRGYSRRLQAFGR